MTNDECDVLIAVSAEPRRRMMLSDMTPPKREIAAKLTSPNGPLISFVGGWVALTDGGYDAMILHCAKNF